MLTIAARIVTAALGALALFIAANIFIDPLPIAEQLGVSATRDVGLAAIRGDLGGFFGVMGLFTAAAAALNDRRLLLPPLALVTFALAGRTLSLFQIDATEAVVQPMIVEMVALAILLGGIALLSRKQDGQ